MASPEALSERLDPRAIDVQRIVGAITTAILSLVLAISALIGFLTAPWPFALRLMLPFAWIVVSGMLLAFALWWPGVSWRYVSYQVDEINLSITRGVVWRSHTVVPRSRIQHTDVSRGPIERMYELATLVVYTAGTEHAAVHLSGLAHDRALAVRDRLLRAGGQDDGV